MNMTLSLSPNEFVDKNDSIGLFPYDPDPLEFLTVEKEIEQTIYIDSELPSLEIYFELSDIKRTQEREFYTLMTFIGDVGGFNSAMTLFPMVIMSFYNQKMYS